MKQFRKLFIFVLIATIFLVPMLVSCDEETPAVPTDWKALFKGELEKAIDKFVVANVTVAFDLDKEDITVTIANGADEIEMLGAAKALADALRVLTDVGTKLTIEDGINAETYDLHDGLATFEGDMRILFAGGGNEVPYSATIKYKGKSLTLSGNIEVVDQR